MGFQGPCGYKSHIRKVLPVLHEMYDREHFWPFLLPVLQKFTDREHFIYFFHQRAKPREISSATASWTMRAVETSSICMRPAESTRALRP